MTRYPIRWVLAAAVISAGLMALAAPVALLLAGDRGVAAFGDSAPLRGHLSSATVDIEVGPNTVPVTVSQMAPGDRATGRIEVTNAGTLPLRYALVGEPSPGPLAPWLRWEVWDAASKGRCDSAAGQLLADQVLDGVVPVAFFGDAAVGPDPGDRILDPGQVEVLCLAATLALGAPDGLQNQRLVPRFRLAAEQQTGDSP
jgi:hypothetical protein